MMGDNFKNKDQDTAFADNLTFVPTDCVCFNTRKVSRTITQMYDEALRPIGLRSGQMNLLVAICTLGECTIQQLANEVWLDRSALSRNIRPLMEKEFIHVIAGPDKRTRKINITPGGLTILERAIPLWNSVQERLKDILGERQINELLAQIEDVCTKLKPSEAKSEEM